VDFYGEKNKRKKLLMLFGRVLITILALGGKHCLVKWKHLHFTSAEKVVQ